MKEFPNRPDQAPDLETAVTWALAVRNRRSEHGQLCPVWTRQADVSRCDCWIVGNARWDAMTALGVVTAWHMANPESGYVPRQRLPRR